MATYKIQHGVNAQSGVKGLIKDGERLIYGVFLTTSSSRRHLLKMVAEGKKITITGTSTKTIALSFVDTFVDKKIKANLDKSEKPEWLSVVSSELSTRSSSTNMYFLVHKNVPEEELLKKIKGEFFKKVLSKLPLPLKEEWQDHFWDYISEDLSPLETIGDLPVRGFKLSLANQERLEYLLEKCHAKAEFKKRFKRVPQLDSVLSVMDIDNFDIKGWSSFLSQYGKEAFAEKNINIQKGIVSAFELLGLKSFDTIVENEELWHALNMKSATVVLRLADSKQRKEAIKNMFKRLTDKYLNTDFMAAIVDNFEDLTKEQDQNIKNKNWPAIERFLKTIRYKGVRAGAEELAAACGRAMISQKLFEEYQSLYFKGLSKGQKVARDYPTISNDLRKVSWEMLDMTVPRALIVGTETYCCMNPHNVGGACLEYASANMQTSGIFRVEEKGRTIAQSFMWLSGRDRQGYAVMCLDNIETAGKDIKDSVIEAYLDFTNHMEKYAKLFKIKAITVGAGYSDINLANFCSKKLSKSDDLFAKIPSNLEYSDAKTQWLLKEF